MKKLYTLFIVLLACTGSSWGQSAIIGTGTLTTDGASKGDPVERLYEFEHYQIVYTTAELTAAGMPAGAVITALGFSISESAGSLANYTISMGHTTQATAVPYISDLNTVRTAFPYKPVVQTAGNFDMIAFTSNFTWDGRSNIVVNTCTGSNPYSYYGGLRYTVAESGVITYIHTEFEIPDVCSATSSLSAVEKPNIRLDYLPCTCSGTPTPGSTISSANPVCPDVNFTLSLETATTGSCVTYQWQSSPDGLAPWTNIGASLPTCTTLQESATYYRCMVTCSGSTGTSSVLYVTMNPEASCYCISAATLSTGEDVVHVHVGTLNNYSFCYTTGGPGSIINRYSNYTTTLPAPDLQQGSSNPSNVGQNTCTTYSGNSTKIFIDFNQNLSFTDPGELVFTSPYIESFTGWEAGFPIAVPGDALLGQTRMRVVNVETIPGLVGACGTYAKGETEDYMVNIVPPSPILFVEPTSFSFGLVDPGSTSDEMTYSLSGSRLTLPSGVVTITPPANFEVSLKSGTGFSSSPITKSYTEGTLAPTNIYVRFKPTASGTVYSGNVTNVASGATTVNVAVTGTSNFYCSSKATFPQDEDIVNVTLGSLSNTSTCATTGGPGSVLNQYSNYTATVAAPVLQRSSVNAFSVGIGTCGAYDYQNGMKIFIDFNQDGDFTDSGEEVYVSPTSALGAHTETGSILVPGGATLGDTRMRVVDVETDYPEYIASCGTYEWGETEDYTVKIIPAVPATGTVQNDTVVYGQDTCYNAMETITVAGSGTTFVVEDGGSATMIAGLMISYLPGVKVMPGGYMLGHITTADEYCGFPFLPLAPVLISTEEIKPGSEQSFFKVYPNPTSGNFKFEIESQFGSADLVVEVYGLMGNKILSERLTGELMHEFSLADKPSGIYFIRVISGNRIEMIKIVRQ